MDMRVYKDFTAYEPKPMFNLTWRQLAAVAIGGPIALGAFVLTTWLYLISHGWHYEGTNELFSMTADDSSLMNTATTWALFPTVLLFIPFAIYGWVRPKGLKPERYLPYWYDYMKNPKELCYGSDAYLRGPAQPLRERESVDRGHRRGSRAERRAERRARAFVPSEHAAPPVPEEAPER